MHGKALGAGELFGVVRKRILRLGYDDGQTVYAVGRNFIKRLFGAFGIGDAVAAVYLADNFLYLCLYVVAELVGISKVFLIITLFQDRLCKLFAAGAAL